jgi:hypothetical protein
LFAFANSIRTVAVMVVGLIAMPIARGSISPIAVPMPLSTSVLVAGRQPSCEHDPASKHAAGSA